MNQINKVSVVLATYDERENIRKLIEKIVSFLTPWEYEIIVVDDDSPDGTWEVIEEMTREDPHIQLVRRMHEKGLTSALNEGISRTTGDAVIWMDCDFQHPIRLIPSLIAGIEAGYDVVATSRYTEGGEKGWFGIPAQPSIVRVHKFLARLLSRFTTFILHPKVTDWSSGYLAVRRNIFDHYKLKGDYGEYYIRLMYHVASRGYRFKELPYELKIRMRGYSKTTKTYVSFFLRGIKYMIAIAELKLFKGR